jgi:lipoic acid synthetase
MEKNFKRKGKEKFTRSKSIPIDIIVDDNKLPKPSWIRVKAPSDNALKLKQLLREHKLHSVCEEASCPNLAECFEKKIATFMILGDICTRRCTFCDVAHGKPNPVDRMEPYNLSVALSKMGLKYIVITSVDRDDLKDGGASHFAACINAIRDKSPNTKIEILVPDFRGKIKIALENLATSLPDVFNHNIETVPRLYKTVRPGSKYLGSLQLIKEFKQRFPTITTKSGIMVGLGETDEEVRQVLLDLRNHDCDMLTIGQYLQPSKFHAPVDRFVTPAQFAEFATFAYSLGFLNVASGALVRSSYYAEQQAEVLL